MNFQVLTWPDALASLEARWIELVERNAVNPSLHPRWLDASLRSHDMIEGARVLHVTATDRTVAIVPTLARDITIRGIPLRSLEVASNLISYHAQIIGEAAAGMDALIDHAKSIGADVIRIANVPDDTGTAAAIAAAAASGRVRLTTAAGEASPFVAIECDWDTFIATRNKKFRANLTRTHRQMQQAGESAMRWFVEQADAERLLGDMLAIESTSWKARSGIAISQRPKEREYYARLLAFLAQHGALLANVVYVRERPAAYVLCARWGGWIGQLKTSFDEEIRDAGARVIDESVRRAFELGCREYDFLGDAAPHKLKWTENVRKHTDYWLFGSTVLSRIAQALISLTRLAQRSRRFSS